MFKVIQMITRRGLWLSHLHEHKFKYNCSIVQIHSEVAVRVVTRPLIFLSNVLYLIIKDITC